MRILYNFIQGRALRFFKMTDIIKIRQIHSEMITDNDILLTRGVAKWTRGIWKCF